MGEVKHTPTPGPWRAFEDRIYGICRDGREHIIVDCDSPYVQDAEANARLIAAAPDMEAMLIEAKTALEYAARGADVITSDKLAVTIGKIASVLSAAEGR